MVFVVPLKIRQALVEISEDAVSLTEEANKIEVILTNKTIVMSRA